MKKGPFERIQFHPEVMSSFDRQNESTRLCLMQAFRDMLAGRLELVEVIGIKNLLMVNVCSFRIVASLKQQAIYIEDIKFDPMGADV